MTHAHDDIGTRIRVLRVAKGLTQAALAARVGVDSRTIRGWELGGRPVRDVYLQPLAQALHVRVSELSPAHPSGIDSDPREDETPIALLDAVADILAIIARANEDVRKVLTRTQVAVPGDVAARLSEIMRELGVPPLVSSDVVTQTSAALTLGVSRQAVHQKVAEGRVRGYPNLERPDRAPMVSLAEVRNAMRHHAEKAASDGDAFADRATEQIRPLNPQPENADTTPGGSPLPEQRTPAEPASDEGLPDPPWLSDEYVRTAFRESSAAATGVPFEELGQEEQDELIRLHTELTREIWREKTAEERAEMIARWQKRRSS